MTDDIWGEICAELQDQFGENNYKTWIAPLKLNGIADGVAEFGVATSFSGDWVSRNYGDQIIRRMKARDVSIERLSFVVSKKSSPGKSASTKSVSAPRQTGNVVPKFAETMPRRTAGQTFHF